jgi:hypothetical protein
MPLNALDSRLAIDPTKARMANPETGSHLAQIFTIQDEAKGWARQPRSQKGSASKPLPIDKVTSSSNESEGSTERRPLQKMKKEKSHKMPAKNPHHHRQPTDKSLAQQGNRKKGKGTRRTSKRKPRDREHDSDDKSSQPNSSDDPSEGSESEDTSSDSNNSSLENLSSSSSSSSTASFPSAKEAPQKEERPQKGAQEEKAPLEKDAAVPYCS